MTVLRFVIHCVLVAVCMLLAGCGEQPEQPAAGNTFRYAVADPVASLDPVHATPPTARLLNGAIYDTLYRYQYLARPYALSTGLADGFPEISADGLSYTIRIRRNVLFHQDAALSEDAREVTARDVIYSLLRHFDPLIEGQGAWLWNEYIKGVTAWRTAGADYDQPPAGLQTLDRYTVSITLSKPYADFLHTLALPVAAIVSRQVIEHYGQDYALHPVGSGPYRLHGFTLGLIKLTANPDYQPPVIELAQLGYQAARHQDYGLARLEGRQPPLLDAIEVHLIRDPQARWQALRRQQVDAMLLPASLYDEVLSSRQPAALQDALAEQLHSNHQPTALLYKIDFNMDDIRLGEVGSPEQRSYNHQLRCQLSAAFDWRGYNEEFFEQAGFVYPGVVPPLLADAETYADAEPPAVGRLTDFKHLPQLDFGYSDSALNQRIFEYFQTTLAAAGYPRALLVARPYIGFSAFATSYSQRQLPLIHTGWALDYPSALNTLQLYLSDNASPGPGLANYQNPEFDRLFAQAAASVDGVERQRLIALMQQILNTDCVTMAGFSPGQIHVWNRQFVLYPDSEFAAGELLRYVMPLNSTVASGKL